jgi:hypothetical protein
LSHIIRNTKAIKTTIGCPIEAERAAANPDEISVWLNRLSSIVDGIPRELVFNVTKPGVQIREIAEKFASV